MSQEIERKFLITVEPSDLSSELKVQNILQGYIAIHDDNTEVRIRQKENNIRFVTVDLYS